MNIEVVLSELKFKAIRSSGSGGQHVNKVASKVELSFQLLESKGFSEEEKEWLLGSLKQRLTKDNKLILQCDDTRSQHKNKEIVKQRFIEIIQKGLIIPKERIGTKIPKAVLRKRLKSKQKLSEKKTFRKKPDIDKN